MNIGLMLDGDQGIAEHAVQAERLGFDHIAVGEHVFFYGPTTNPFVALGAAASATKNVGLLSCLSLLPLYPAALAAKMVSTLARLSDGRFEYGVGAGGEYVREFLACGVDPADRFAKFDESLKIVRLLLGGGAIEYAGHHATLDDVRLDPQPWASGQQRIWIGGRRSGARRRVAQHGDVWIPYMVTPQMVADGLDDIRDQSDAHGRDGSAISGALFVWCAIDDDGVRARRVGIDAVSATYQQDFAPLADRYLLLGTPGEIVRRLREYSDAGVRSVTLGLATHDATERDSMVRMLSDEVLPVVGGAAAKTHRNLYEGGTR